MKIKVVDLSHSFESNINKKFDAVSNANFSIDKHEFIGIIGPTGSGKTTLIEHLNCLLTPTKGQIEFDYTIPKKNNPHEKENIKKVVKKSWRKIKGINEIRKLVGIVFQFSEYQLFEETIEKDIIFGPINIGISKEKAKEIAKEMIVKVGLDESYLQRSPFELSGGQKRRVAIAGILSMLPDILIFDEPTAGLDPEGARDILNLFHKLYKDGKTIIIVTHNLDDVLEFTERTIFMKEGKIIIDDNTMKVLTDEKLLLENNMSIPKIVDLTNRLNRRHSIKIPYTKSIDEFAYVINFLKDKRRSS